MTEAFDDAPLRDVRFPAGSEQDRASGGPAPDQPQSPIQSQSGPSAAALADVERFVRDLHMNGLADRTVAAYRSYGSSEKICNIGSEVQSADQTWIVGHAF